MCKHGNVFISLCLGEFQVKLLSTTSYYHICIYLGLGGVYLVGFGKTGERSGTSLGILAPSGALQTDAQCGEKSDVIITLCGLVSVEPYHALVYVHTSTDCNAPGFSLALTECVEQL